MTSFFVVGQDLYDLDGTKVIFHGVNKMSVFDNDYPHGLVSPDSKFANFKSGWAYEVAISSPFGIQKTSVILVSRQQ